MLDRGVDPKIWGPSGWNILHAVAFSGKPNKEFFESVGLLLPCPQCRRNYSQHVAALKGFPTRPRDYGKWSYELHNKVRGSSELAYKDVERLWKNRTLKFEEALPFFEAIVETHPGAKAVTVEYMRAERIFWEVVMGYFNIKHAQAPAMADLSSRTRMRLFLRKIKKETGAGAIVRTPLCSKDLCSLPVA